MEKLTKKDKFQMLKELAKDNEMLTEFVEHEIKMLDRKASNHTPTKNQKENEELKSIILNVLQVIGKPMSIAEIQNENPILAEKTNQKISALLKQLVDKNLVERINDKKKTYFRLV